MRHDDAALRHHDHQIPQAQFKTRVPPDTQQDDDLPAEVPPVEYCLDWVEPLIPHHLRRRRVCIRTVWGMGIDWFQYGGMKGSAGGRATGGFRSKAKDQNVMCAESCPTRELLV
jgi:hypothetical protein